MLANVHSIFGHCYVVSKIEKEEKMEEKLYKSLIDGEIEFKFP